MDIYEKHGNGKEQSEARGEINWIDSSNNTCLRGYYRSFLTCQINYNLCKFILSP